ncbi:MAG: regulatory protein RecX [Pseudomonadota bacterium]
MMDDHISVNEDAQKVRRAALNYLAKREYTFFSLQKKLLQKGFSSHAVQATLSLLVQEELLNDGRFCEAFIASRIRKNYGPVRIAAELRQHGINEEVIISEIKKNEAIWLDCIKKIQKKKFSSPAENLKEKLRRINFLQYRGFKLDQIKECFELTDKI